MPHPPAGHDPEPTWVDATIAGLDEDLRGNYEQLCDILEEEFLAGTDLSDLVDRLQEHPSPIRELVALNLAKCWGEDQLDAVGNDWAPTEGEVLAVFPELGALPIVFQEWRDWLDEERRTRTGLDSGNGLDPGDPEPIREIKPEQIVPSSHELVRPLSTTKMSHLFLVKNRTLNRLEVLKAVRTSDLHPALLGRLEDEATRAGKLTHPGLLQVFGAEESGDWRYLLMEYMNGGSLADRLRAGPLPWELAVRHFATVARALEALHHKGGLAHGDIKPENLMFTRQADDDEYLKLGDFGLSSNLSLPRDEDSASGILIGTPGYLAPELFQRSTDPITPFDVKVTADVFALGVSLYRAISGVLPYQESDSIDPRGALKHPYEPIERRVSGLPEVVAYLVKRGCATDRTIRFASAGEFARALEKCVPLSNETHTQPTSTTSSSSPVSPSGVEERPIRRVRPEVWKVAGAIVVTLLLLRVIFPPVGDDGPIDWESGQEVSAVSSEAGPRLAGAESRRLLVPLVEDKTPDEMKVLTESGWSDEAAQAVLELNASWFEAIRADPASESLAVRQLNELADLGDSSLMRTFARSPQAASAATLSEPGGRVAMVREFEKELQEEQGPGAFTSFLVQYPFRGSADRCVDAWRTRREAIQAMSRNGLIGAEQIYVSARDDDRAFVNWVEDLLVHQIARESRRREDLLAIFLEHHEGIARRMLDEPGFASRFQNSHWPEFLRMSAERRPSTVLLDGGIWDVFELDGGAELLKRYGRIAVAAFSGPGALPEDSELRRAAVRRLKSGFSPVLEAIGTEDVRLDRNFQLLMQRPLPDDAFAVLCYRIINAEGDAEALIADYSRKSDDHLLTDMTGEDRNRWYVESIVPQAVYLRVGLKLLSGESLYDVEKASAVTQVASDVMTVALVSVGVDPTLVRSAQQGFDIGKEAGQEAVKELLKAERLQALSDRGEATEEVVEAKADVLRAILREIAESLEADNEIVLDVTRARMFFEQIVRACEGDREVRKIDLRNARLFRAPGGSIFGVPSAHPDRPELQAVAVQRFFHDRLALIAGARAGREAQESANRAYQEVVSAWWLLGACDRVPFMR